jgi:hypothetical protein
MVAGRGGGSVRPFDDWLAETTGDEEFDPLLCFLAASPRGLAGAALCWRSFATFATRDATAVELNVQSTNPGAVRLYERVGFRVVDRLLPR